MTLALIWMERCTVYFGGSVVVAARAEPGRSRSTNGAISRVVFVKNQITACMRHGRGRNASAYRVTPSADEQTVPHSPSEKRVAVPDPA